MSDGFSPASSSARLLACAFSPRPDKCGTLPISDSPTPTIATLFFSVDACGSAARVNCGISAPSLPRSSNVSFTRSPIDTSSALGPTTLVNMRGPSSRSTSAITYGAMAPNSGVGARCTTVKLWTVPRPLLSIHSS